MKLGAQIVATTTNSRLSATGKSNRLIIGRLIQSARVGFKPSRTLALSIMPINAQPSTRSTNTKVVQQNLNRNTIATNQLIKDLSSNKYDIAVIQEPHTYTKSDRHHISSISSYTSFYTNDTSRPRAAIIAANHLSPVFLLQYSTVDTCVVSIQINQQKIVIVNTYFPPDAPIAQCLNHLESIVQSFNEDLLICVNLNQMNTTTRRFATKNVDWTKFKTSIHIRYDSMIEKLNNAQSSNEIEQAAENIIENIVASCEQSLPQNAKETSEYLLNKFLPDDNPLSDNNYHKRIREVASADNGGTNMDALFSQEEMQQAIEDMNDKKAPGEDGISANVLKHFSATAPNNTLISPKSSNNQLSKLFPNKEVPMRPALKLGDQLVCYPYPGSTRTIND
ncbi:hypothetical protein BLOT_006807 [Blomia tropicalis]|nr:hypothetical protein BLOT_006807 [Blomia tropicalis]